MKLFFLFLNIVPVIAGWSTQQHTSIVGKVMDARTKGALSNATLRIKNHSIEYFTDPEGGFEFTLPDGSREDTLEVSYVGYVTLKLGIGSIRSPLVILLEDYPLQLKTVTITSRRLNLRDVDNGMRQIKDNLYAYETETTNRLYNLFLGSLEERGQTELLEQCGYSLTGYDEKTRHFYEEYHAPVKATRNKKGTSPVDYSDFPVVNISHGAAVVFMKWLTEEYNGIAGKKKFRKVRFRLPTRDEWQIAALGYARFQSWKLEENKVDVVIPADTVSNPRTGPKTTVPVDREILYPWFTTYNYRKKAQNHMNCFLGNFKVPEGSKLCDSPAAQTGGDGWIMTARTASYFPNDMGFYDVVGNVAEMIDEKGKAFGGSWNDHPANATIHSVKSYNKPDATVGFRIFMEVIEP